MEERTAADREYCPDYNVFRLDKLLARGLVVVGMRFRRVGRRLLAADGRSAGARAFRPTLMISSTATSPAAATTIASIMPRFAAFVRPVLSYSFPMFLVFDIAHRRAGLHFAAFLQRRFP
jgi:hypothetical protein